MEEKRADVVFVIDASDSMKPCFEQLKRSIKEFVKPFTQVGYDSLRLGLLAYNAGTSEGHWVYRHTFIGGDAPELTPDMYGLVERLRNGEDVPDEDSDNYFTRSEDGEIDVDSFIGKLDEIECCADENTPLALDCAADFPFGPLCTTRRVIILFTDEKMEDGVLRDEPLAKIESVMKKIEMRHISLYYFGPNCEMAELISEFPRVYATEVKDYSTRSEDEDVWSEIDFDKVMEGIGKNISMSSLQLVDELPFDMALYGQDKWGLDVWGKAEDGIGVIDITDQSEGVELDMSMPLEWINATMRWHTPIDLDIHAFYSRVNSDRTEHIFYGNKSDDVMNLDYDAGISNKIDFPSGNEENIKVLRPDRIRKLLIATMIFAKKGCYSDYNGEVEVTTNNPRQQIIRVKMVSRERKDWCVIAMVDNSNPDKPKVYPVNEVTEFEPDVNDSRWER